MPLDSHSCALASHRNGAPFTIPPRARGFIREKILAGKFVPYFAIDTREVIGRARKTRAVLKVITQHLQAVPVPPSERTELPIPAALDRLVLACLAKKPEERPQSARQLAQSLEDD